MPLNKKKSSVIASYSALHNVYFTRYFNILQPIQPIQNKKVKYILNK